MGEGLRGIPPEEYQSEGERIAELKGNKLSTLTPEELKMGEEALDKKNC